MDILSDFKHLTRCIGLPAVRDQLAMAARCHSEMPGRYLSESDLQAEVFCMLREFAETHRDDLADLLEPTSRKIRMASNQFVYSEVNINPERILSKQELAIRAAALREDAGISQADAEVEVEKSFERAKRVDIAVIVPRLFDILGDKEVRQTKAYVWYSPAVLVELKLVRDCTKRGQKDLLDLIMGLYKDNLENMRTCLLNGQFDSVDQGSEVGQCKFQVLLGCFFRQSANFLAVDEKSLEEALRVRVRNEMRFEDLDLGGSIDCAVHFGSLNERLV